MTEAAIDSGFWGDIYVALGESLGKAPNGKEAWAIRLHDKPFVNWIWLGSFMMGLGGFLAISDRRYRMAGRVKNQTDHSESKSLSESSELPENNQPQQIS